MNKTAPTELHRVYLIERLPEPLTPASSHLQIFDNYIEHTRIRLRQVRDPYSNTWTRMLQQRFPVAEGEHPMSKLAEIHLNESEYGVFQQFMGREVRKNRYFHEFDAVSFAFDVYLGRLAGLHTARVDFAEAGRMQSFVPPPFAQFEITNSPYFTGESLVDKSFAEIRDELGRASSAVI